MTDIEIIKKFLDDYQISTAEFSRITGVPDSTIRGAFSKGGDRIMYSTMQKMMALIPNKYKNVDRKK